MLYGARPLKRLIQRQLLDPLAIRLLDADFIAGDEVDVDWDGERYTFSAVTPEAPAEVLAIEG